MGIVRSKYPPKYQKFGTNMKNISSKKASLKNPIKVNENSFVRVKKKTTKTTMWKIKHGIGARCTVFT